MMGEDAEPFVLDQRMKEQRGYWTQRLSRGLMPRHLPLAGSRPAAGPESRDRIELEVPPDVDEALTRLTGGGPFLLYTTLMAALKVCLRRCSRSDVIVVASPSRRRPGGAGRPNVLAIVDSIRGDCRFRDLLLQVRATLLAAYARQDYPYARLIHDLSLEGTDDRFPLGDVVLVLPEIHDDLPETENDVTITFRRTGKELEGLLEFRSDRLDGTIIASLASSFIEVLKRGVEDTTVTIQELESPFLSEREVERERPGDTRGARPEVAGAHRLFERQAERTPDAVAVVASDTRWTYGELNRRSNQLARHLQSFGVGPEVTVGVLMGRCPQLIAAILGVLKSGGAFVPIDPSTPRDRATFMLDQAGACVLLTHGETTQRPTLEGVTEISIDREWQAVSRYDDRDLESGVSAENLAYVIYTSGSTGRPKGVMIPHQGLVNYLEWSVRFYQAASGRGAPVHTSLEFDATLTSVFGPLSAGTAVFLVPEGPGAEGLLASMATQPDFSFVKVTPAHLDLMSRFGMEKESWREIRRLICGGEALLGSRVQLLAKRCPTTRLINEYGPTETVVGCCAYETTMGAIARDAVPIGRPIANMQAYLLDDRLEPVATGVPGELHVAGPGVARGYVGRADLTAACFLPSPFGHRPGSRMYRTGDICRSRADAHLLFLGRSDFQIDLRGMRIEPEEIEGVLRETGWVKDVLVAVTEEDGPDRKQLVAYLVPQAGWDFNPGELRRYLGSKLPRNMIPTLYAVLDEIPRTPHGKVDRKNQPPRDPSRSTPEVGYVAPRTGSEELIAGVWAEFLGVARVGIQDDFFDLGGHSLLATRVVSRLRRVFEVDLPLRSIFESPTVAGIAVKIVQQKAREVEESTLGSLLEEVGGLTAGDVRSQLLERTAMADDGTDRT